MALGANLVKKVAGGAAKVVAGHPRAHFFDELQEARLIEHSANEEEAGRAAVLPELRFLRLGIQLGQQLGEERVEFLAWHLLGGIQDGKVNRCG